MASINTTSDILSRDAAAEYLSICKSTLDKLDIPRTKIRKRVLYRKSTLDNWLVKQEKTEKQRHESVQS